MWIQHSLKQTVNGEVDQQRQEQLRSLFQLRVNSVVQYFFFPIRIFFLENTDMKIIIIIIISYLTWCFASRKVLFQNKPACKRILSLLPLQFREFILFECFYIYVSRL